MKCLVCGKEFNNEIYQCPVCAFPVPQFPGNPEEGIRALEPTIRAHRETLSKLVRIGVVLYQYEVSWSDVRETGKETADFGSVYRLLGKPVWLDRRFKAFEARKNCDIQLCVDMGDRAYTIQVNVPSIQDAEEYELGIAVDDNFMFRLMLRDNKNTVQSSADYYLFAQQTDSN